MAPAVLAAAWTSTFGTFAPAGFECRERLRDRWLRIHSLPQSKRYPETAEEFAELLQRHNEVATQTLCRRSSNKACTLFLGQIDFSPGVPDADSLPEVGAAWVDCPDLSMPLDGGGGGEWLRVAAAAVEWRPGAFDELIRAVAEDQVDHVLFANLELGQAYAPYDGGADLILIGKR